MPFDAPDPEDPTLLIGVELPANEAADLEMAYVFAEEFARLGFSEAQLLSLFRQPYYAGAYRTLRALGERKVREIVRETLRVWGQSRQAVEDAWETRPEWDVGLESLRPGAPEREKGER